MDQPRSLEEVLSPIDSVVVLTHSYLQAGFKFGARRLNLASDFGKGIERVFDVTIMDRGKHDFDIDFFSFLQWHDAVSFEQGNYFHVRGCNIAIYIVFFHRTNLPDPVAPTLESFPGDLSVRPEQFFDSIYSGVDHHLVSYRCLSLCISRIRSFWFGRIVVVVVFKKPKDILRAFFLRVVVATAFDRTGRTDIKRLVFVP
mmetsp:Transcript_14427/g.29942  ORF Transcript_14427/g.29942 Transcript_14427/m.29942 type:complete len:200 (+) Transcript_14427:160-759(+)